MKFWFCLAALLACAISGPAQVTVEVTQDQEQFLPGESLNIAVRITNRSGQTLQLGGEEDWLTFAIEAREGIVVPKLGDAPVLGEFSLESGKVAIKRLDLGPYFIISQPGHYSIVATVRVREWNRDIISPEKPFDVIQGAKLWEQDVGVPKAPGATNLEPEIRRYVLQQMNSLRGQLRLYVRVTDSYGKNLKVLPVGPILTFSRPDPQVDRLSNLHILYQDGPFSFNYTVCNVQGEIVTRQTYDYTETRPRLRIDSEGDIVVAGGKRRLSATDVPTSVPETNSGSEIPPLAAAVPPTNQPPKAVKKTK